MLRFKATHNSVECEEIVRPTTIYYSFPEFGIRFYQEFPKFIISNERNLVFSEEKNCYLLNNLGQAESAKLISCMENSSAEDEENLSSSKTLPSIQESYTNSSKLEDILTYAPSGVL